MGKQSSDSGRGIKSIREKYAHAVRCKCEESGCRLGLKNLAEYVILRGDNLCSDQRMCDCIVFHARRSIIIGVVELKSKTVHARTVVKKLQNSSKMASTIMGECFGEHQQFEILPIVLAKSWAPVEMRILARGKTRVKGKKQDILMRRCGEDFSGIMSGYLRG